MSDTPSLGPEHALLATFVGTWTGEGSLWMAPGTPPDVAGWTVTGTSLHGGRFVRLAYTHSVGGEPHSGELTLAYERDEKRFTAAWIDTFHTGTLLLVSHGEGPEFDVYTTWPAGEERWGWRTRISRKGEGLEIAMGIIPPGRPEAPAVEVRLHPAG